MGSAGLFDLERLVIVGSVQLTTPALGLLPATVATTQALTHKRLRAEDQRRGQ